MSKKVFKVIMKYTLNILFCSLAALPGLIRCDLPYVNIYIRHVQTFTYLQSDRVLTASLRVLFDLNFTRFAQSCNFPNSFTDHFAPINTPCLRYF